MDVQTTEKKALLEAVLQGRLGFFRACGAYSPLPGADFQENAEGSFYYSSGIDYAACNGVMGPNDGIPSEREIEKVIEFFDNRKLPFIWWTSAKNLESKGFQFGGVLTGIALDISKDVPNQESTTQIQIKIIHSKEDLSSFASLAVNAFGMSRRALEQFQAVHTAAMQQGEQVHFLAMVDGHPVGAVTLSITESSAGIWNLATLPKYRKQGVGTLLVHKAIIEAQKRKYDQVMAILMPKGMAWGLFAKLGFKEACQFPFYVYGVSAEALEK